MPRLLLHAFAALVTLVVPALLDLGAQLHAGPISFGDEGSPVGLVACQSPLSSGEQATAGDEAPPAVPLEVVPLDPAPLPEACPRTSGAGSMPPPRSLSGSTGAAVLVAEGKAPCPQLIALLAQREQMNRPNPIPSSIFHPPR